MIARKEGGSDERVYDQATQFRDLGAFADLAEAHNGVWGGCWCTYFHLYPDPTEERRALGHREFKRRLVEAGRAHAALVFDGDAAVAWAQFGTVPELPNIHHRKEWEQGVAQMPDYRITCLFVDRAYRRAGMAAVAVRGALALIAAAGGGLVEAYPHDLPEGKKTSASFLYNATRTMYERLGFSYERSKGRPPAESLVASDGLRSLKVAACLRLTRCDVRRSSGNASKRSFVTRRSRRASDDSSSPGVFPEEARRSSERRAESSRSVRSG